MVKTIFETYLNDEHDDLNKYLSAFKPNASHKDMDKYLYDPLVEFGMNGGKRHRPSICMLACVAVGGKKDDALAAGAAIEHFHIAALIHDDIADKSQIRHNKPCLHISEGVALAINAGDLALSRVTGTVLEDDNLDDAKKIRVLEELVDMTSRTIEGQALDIGWVRDGRWDVTVDDYLLMAEHKTAFYSGSVPLAVGAIIGNGSEEQIEVLRKYGLSTGLAFQIQDDILNLVGKKESATKDFRSDITEGKRTMVVVHALSNTKDSDREELLQILSSKTTDATKLQRAVDIMQKVGSIDYVRSYAIDLAKQYQNDLKKVLRPSLARKQLLSMADFFVNRLN